LRIAPLRDAVLQAGLHHARQSRGRVVSDALAAGEARKLGQAERHDTLAARNSRLAPGETITVRVRRSDGLAAFQVPYRKWMRVLDALNWIAENAATDLAFRWFCGSKMCGTC